MTGKTPQIPNHQTPQETLQAPHVVRVDTGADVNCMNEKTFNELFPEVELLYAPMRYRISETQLQTFQYWDNSIPTWSLGVKST